MHANKDIVKYLKSSGFDDPLKPLDAAVTTTLGVSSSRKFQILFKGDKYSLYTSFMRKHSGPHSIYDASGPLKVEFPSYVKKINAAMRFRKKVGKVYFFFRLNDRGYYYRYDTRRRVFDAGYPKAVTQGFINIPTSGPEAAISSKRTKTTYFVANNLIYKMDDRYAKVVYGYPKKRGGELMRCAQALNDKSSYGPLYFLQRLLHSLDDTDVTTEGMDRKSFRSVELDD